MRSFHLVFALHWKFPLFQQIDRPIFLENFARDPVANSIAVVVLLGMFISVIAVAYAFLQDSDLRSWRWPRWSIPVLAILGAGVAGYLLFVEATGANAVCGPTGDCNAVQDSPYSQLFGIIPVGLLGLVGYVSILIAWLIEQYGPPQFQKLLSLAIWGMAWFGIAFSIYLTILEPFVIGATCMWCISSAVIITLILWASTHPAKDYLKIGEDEFEDEEIASL